MVNELCMLWQFGRPNCHLSMSGNLIQMTGCVNCVGSEFYRTVSFCQSQYIRLLRSYPAFFSIFTRKEYPECMVTAFDMPVGIRCHSLLRQLSCVKFVVAADQLNLRISFHCSLMMMDCLRNLASYQVIPCRYSMQNYWRILSHGHTCI